LLRQGSLQERQAEEKYEAKALKTKRSSAQGMGPQEARGYPFSSLSCKYAAAKHIHMGFIATRLPANNPQLTSGL
jgi:hypothetical protein